MGGQDKLEKKGDELDGVVFTNWMQPLDGVLKQDRVLGQVGAR
jgi:hypothetical protein